MADILPTMTMPCLLYAGENDAANYAKARECAQHLPNAIFWSLPSLGHLEAHSESSLVLPHVMKFLSENS